MLRTFCRHCEMDLPQGRPVSEPVPRMPRLECVHGRYLALGEARAGEGGGSDRAAAAAGALQVVLRTGLEALATLLPAGSFRIAPPICTVSRYLHDCSDMLL